MRCSLRMRPQVLTLEGRTLMSGASTHAPATAEHRARPAHGISVVLNGRTTDLVTVDKKGIAHVTGSGHMSGLGPVSISGTVNTKAENALLATPGLLYANLVISTPKGEINVHVTPGTIGLNPFAQPVHMQYSLAGGTGAFHHAVGKGLVDVNLYQAIPIQPDRAQANGGPGRYRRRQIRPPFPPRPPEPMGQLRQHVVRNHRFPRQEIRRPSQAPPQDSQGMTRSTTTPE